MLFVARSRWLLKPPRLCRFLSDCDPWLIVAAVCSGRVRSVLPADVVHREVVSVSKGLLAAARFSDHVAGLTGRQAAEHLKVAALNSPA